MPTGIHWHSHFPLLVYIGEKVPWYVINRLHRWDCFFLAVLAQLSCESRRFLYVSWMEDIIYGLDAPSRQDYPVIRFPYLCRKAEEPLKYSWSGYYGGISADWTNLLIHLFPLMLFSLVSASWISVETRICHFTEMIGNSNDAVVQLFSTTCLPVSSESIVLAFTDLGSLRKISWKVF